MLSPSAKGGATKARRVREAAGLGLDGPIGDLLALAEVTCGVPVAILPSLGGDLAGAYLPRGGDPLILLNGADPAPRLRFTLAHELAHHVFRDDRRADTHAGLARPGHWIEVRANAFAAELLMPAPAVEAWAAGRPEPGVAEVEALAARFGTSLLAAAIRLETLGLVAGPEALRAVLRDHVWDGGSYEDSITRAGVPRLPRPNSVLAAALGAGMPAGRAAAQTGHAPAVVAAALALLPSPEEEGV